MGLPALQSELPTHEEPCIALAPGALGGLIVTASVRRPYVSTSAALATIRARLPMVRDVRWDAATIELRRLGARYQYAMFLPPLPREVVSPVDTESAMLGAIREWSEVLVLHASVAMDADTLAAIALVARLSQAPSEIKPGDVRPLYGLAQRLVERVLGFEMHDTTTEVMG